MYVKTPHGIFPAVVEETTIYIYDGVITDAPLTDIEPLEIVTTKLATPNEDSIL